MLRHLLAASFIALAGFAPTAAFSQDAKTTSVASTGAGPAAPDFSGITNWINSKPLHINDLRGKVVLVNFWTYGCINCAHTLPHVAELDRKYRDKGLVIIGVHTPELPFERSIANLQTAVKRNGIEYPVAQDNNSMTWNAYNNEYWPAQYIVDQQGHVVFHHDGEGQYDEIEHTIQQLLRSEG
jgi:thiol-disulfide isomerase/thioredoxin